MSPSLLSTEEQKASDNQHINNLTNNKPSFEWFDEKFSHNKGRYVAQCVLSTMAIFIILLLLDFRSHGALIGALGASAFIAFTMPHAQVSRPRFLLGGYIVGTFSGICCYFLSTLSIIQVNAYMANHTYIIFGALAVGLAIFIMVVTNTEHPPAAGLALGLVLNDCLPKSILIVLIGIIILSSAKELLKPSMINLL